MKEFLIVLALCVLATCGIVFGLHHMIEVRPCYQYGELHGIQSKHLGRCYVEYKGVWVSKYYHESYMDDLIESQKEK